MKIIIFSYSLGRPRPDLSASEKTSIAEVYGEILKSKLESAYEIELIYVESMDSEDAMFWGQRMVAFREPDVVIFHFGINDCAPRLFRKNSKSIILNSTFRKLTADLVLRVAGRLRFYITRFRKISYFNSTEFIDNIEFLEQEVLKFKPSCKFYFIGIAESNV
ncbi:hypothetical protein EGH82_23670, partial [Vibrio ponticus]